jgi:hypothetical protein
LEKNTSYEAANGISKCKLCSVGVQEVRWGGGGTKSAGECTFFYGKGNENYELCIGLFVNKRIISSVKRDGMPYVLLRSRSCDIIVLNVHATTKNKLDGMDSFYEEAEDVFDK